MWPTPGESELPEPYGGVLIAGHLILSLDVTPDEIRMAPLDPEAMLRALRAGDLRMPYSKLGDRVVLQAATTQLRAALGKYVARPGAFLDSTVWRRTTPQLAQVEAPCFEAAAWREADRSSDATRTGRARMSLRR